MKARVCLALLLVSLFTFPAQAATPTPLRDLAPPQRAARVLPGSWTGGPMGRRVPKFATGTTTTTTA